MSEMIFLVYWDARLPHVEIAYNNSVKCRNRDGSRRGANETPSPPTPHRVRAPLRSWTSKHMVRLARRSKLLIDQHIREFYACNLRSICTVVGCIAVSWYVAEAPYLDTTVLGAVDHAGAQSGGHLCPVSNA